MGEPRQRTAAKERSNARGAASGLTWHGSTTSRVRLPEKAGRPVAHCRDGTCARAEHILRSPLPDSRKDPRLADLRQAEDFQQDPGARVDQAARISTPENRSTRRDDSACGFVRV